MRKLLALIAIAGLAGGIATSAMAEEVETPLGTLTVDESGSVHADGAAGNPDPADGYIYVDANGVCAEDEGSVDDNSGDDTCNEELIPAPPA